MGIYTHGGHSYQIEGGNRREAARQVIMLVLLRTSLVPNSTKRFKEIETMRSLKSKMDSLHLRCPYVSIGSTPRYIASISQPNNFNLFLLSIKNSLTFNWSGETDPYKGITEVASSCP